MAHRVGLTARLESTLTAPSPLQLIFDMPRGVRWARLRVHWTSNSPGANRASLQSPDGRELIRQTWIGAWADELFVRVPPGTTHLVLSGTSASEIEILECRLQPVARPHMAWIALRRKLRLLRDHSCTGRALRRAAVLLFTGRWSEFRARVLKGVRDSRFISAGEAGAETYAPDEIAAPEWLDGADYGPTLAGRRAVVLTASLVAGDAVGNDVLGMAHCLRAAGAETYIATRFVTALWPAIPLESLDRILRPGDLLIYHHAIGFAEALRAFEKADCRRVLKYHNITPPELLRDSAPDLAKACEQGLAELPHLLAAAHAVLVDSPFNAESLPEGTACTVLPPFNQIDELLAAADEGYEGHVGILMVGRVAPNKDVEAAIRALAALRQNYRPDARLTVVGAVPSWEYIHVLQTLAEELDIREDVDFLGAVPLGKLKSLYCNADALLCTSRHEGFGLPLLEALALRVPVVAVPRGAVPATLAGCGWLSPDGPADLARTLHRAMLPTDERSVKRMLGERHYRALYTNGAICARFLESLDAALRPAADPLLHLNRPGGGGHPESNFTTANRP